MSTLVEAPPLLTTATPDQTHRDKQLPDSIVCKHLLICEHDFEWTILLGPLIWPVPLTFLLSLLHNIGYHGNHMDPFLPHQPPKVINSVWEGAYKVQSFAMNAHYTDLRSEIQFLYSSP